MGLILKGESNIITNNNKVSDHNIYLEGDTIINGDVVCNGNGFNIDTISVESEIKKLNNTLTIKKASKDFSDGIIEYPVKIESLSSGNTVAIKETKLTYMIEGLSKNGYIFYDKRLKKGHFYYVNINVDESNPGDINGIFYYNKLETGLKTLFMMTTRGNSNYSIVAVPVNDIGQPTDNFDWTSAVGVGFMVTKVAKTGQVKASDMLKCDVYHMNIFIGDFTI